MYTSSKRGYVNAFASRLLRVVHETEQRDQECKDQPETQEATQLATQLEAQLDAEAPPLS